MGNVTGLTLIGNVIDSGYYSLTFNSANTAVTNYRNFIIQDNHFKNFRLGAVNMKDLTGINISSNRFTSYYSGSFKSKSTGIYLENVDSAIVIQKNHIYLIGALTGGSAADGNGKRGIDLKNVSPCLSCQL